ncbi:MAG TPA: NADH-quinone oxidoreductase subunit I [bacterium]|nr:NADH-quinone oxidoreductase subunit I [bacterium]
MFKYAADIIKGVLSLCEGLGVTLKHFFRKPFTLRYPDVRPEIPLRFRGRLVLPVDPDKGAHRCTACMMCVKACPNRSIEIEKETGEDGKPKPRAAKYYYNLGTCIFCNMCVESCPFAAIVMSDEYELAVYDRETLMQELTAENLRLDGAKGAWWKSKFREETAAGKGEASNG